MPDEAPIQQLEAGTLHRFGDAFSEHLPTVAAGVYTVWRGTEFIYVGMAGHSLTREAIAKLQGDEAKGLRDRLASHASGRRSGDQFCIYICDRFIIPELTPSELQELAAGARWLDSRTCNFIRSHLQYRIVVTGDGAEARALEDRIRDEGLPQAGRPLLNPGKKRA